MLSFLGVLEELRDLSLQEWNFRSILQDRLIFLLQQKKIYWKQRGTIRWVTSGDAGTKKFHAHATIRHKKKLITFLEDQTGSLQSNHSIKASMLWESYKGRLGQSEFQTMLLDLHSLLSTSEDLGCRETPFTHQEIDRVIASLPSDKSPGPDGFNSDLSRNVGLLLKRIFTCFVKLSFQGRFACKALMDLT